MRRGVKASVVCTAVVGVLCATLAVSRASWAEPDCVDDGTIVYLDIMGFHSRRQAVRNLAAQYNKCVEIVRGGEGYVYWADELGKILARAERGELRVETLVMAGHSTGNNFFGPQAMQDLLYEDDINFEFQTSHLRALQRDYPHAMKQIEHLFVLGCNTSTMYSSREWQAYFPGAYYVVGSNGSTPGGRHTIELLNGTYGALQKAKSRRQPERVNCEGALADPETRDQLYDTLRGLRIVHQTNAAFRICRQFYTHKKTPAKKFVKDQYLLGLETVFQHYLKADEPEFEDIPASRASSPLRDFYNDAHAYLGMLEANEEIDIRDVTRTKEVAIRLIYFGYIKPWWWYTHADDIEKARDVLAAEHQLAGGEPYSVQLPDGPTFVGMSRKQVLDLAVKLQKAHWFMDDLPGESGEAVRRLVHAAKDQLIDLDPERTPLMWVNKPPPVEGAVAAR